MHLPAPQQIQRRRHRICPRRALAQPRPKRRCRRNSSASQCTRRLPSSHSWTELIVGQPAFCGRDMFSGDLLGDLVAGVVVLLDQAHPARRLVRPSDQPAPPPAARSPNHDVARQWQLGKSAGIYPVVVGAWVGDRIQHGLPPSRLRPHCQLAPPVQRRHLPVPQLRPPRTSLRDPERSRGGLRLHALRTYPRR